MLLWGFVMIARIDRLLGKLLWGFVMVARVVWHVAMGFVTFARIVRLSGKLQWALSWLLGLLG